MPKTKTSDPLTGRALLDKLKDISHLSKSEKAQACGYVTQKGDQTRVNLGQFMNAILEAKGISLDIPREGGGGRKASYRTSVQKNGNILVGRAYTESMGLNPGDELEIKLGRKQIQLKLIAE